MISDLTKPRDILDGYSAWSGAAYQSLIEPTGPGISDAGVTVTVDRALGLAPVWEAVSMISGHIAGMDLDLVKVDRAAQTRELIFDHPVYRLLNRKPNGWQTPFGFRELLMSHALIQGNGRALIVRNRLGQPLALQPLYPWNTYTVIVDGEKYHASYMHPDYPGDDSTGTIEMYADADVLHVPGLSYNGFWGIHLTQVARDALGVAIAGQDRTASSFLNQGMPGFLIEVPLSVMNDPKQRREFRQEWDARYSGSKNAGKMQLLPAGFKAHAASVSANDAQLKDLVSLNTEQIRRLFLLPPDAAAAYKSITERNTQYINNCLHRWMEKISQECRAKLLTDAERAADALSFAFNTDSLIKGDPNNWAAFTGALRQQGLISGNEGRVMHGLNPVDDEALESYGNPNITTEPEESENETESNDTEARTMARKAVRRHFANLIELERRQVRRHAGDASFQAWASDYYKRFGAQMSEVCTDLGLPASLAADHCAESQGQIIEALKSSNPQTRADVIGSTIDNWQSRVERFTANV